MVVSYPPDVNGNMEINTTPETRKQTISEPYNFQHLTHAHAKQLPELGKASQNEIVTEFSAIRASQAPRRELRGIKAENLHFRNFSSETLQQDISNSCFIAPTTPPPSLSPTRSTELLRRNAPSPLPSSNGPRQARSVENFSLPGPKSPRSPQSPIVPPPRTSSRAAMTIAFTSPSACLESPTSPVFGRALIGSPNFSSDRHESAVFLSSNGASTDQTGLPHAVTTPDDSALHLLPLPFGTTGTELADVPEEDESYFRKRSSKQSSRASTAGAALRHSQSFPSNKSCRDGPISHQSMQEIFEVPVQDRRPTSNASNTLGTPFVLEPAANRSSSFVSSRRLSRNLKGIEGDWEDDIDYCYEHEAEADCDFDWDRKSREYGDEKGFPERSDDIQYRAEAFSSRNGHILQEKSVAGRTRNNFYSEDLGRISVSSIDFTIPDLEPASALSTSTSGLDALTPSLSLVSPRASQVHVRASKGSDGFIHSPSLLVPSDYETQMLEEAMYQEMLADGASGDHHYSFYNRIGEAPDSRTDSPLSKCNSQESMAVSRSASAMHTHRSTDSSGSLPELIHSKNSREKFERVADQLAEHIAALNTVEAAIDGHRSISPPYKRRFSPAKEPTHQSMLKKATCNASAEDTEAPAPVVQSMRLRDRSCSDDTVKAGSSSSNCTSASVMAKRIRSSSTATTASGRRSSRVSYTLFPASTLR